MADPAMLLEQLDATFEKIASIDAIQDVSDANKKIKEILQRFVIISKDIVTAIKTLEAQYIADRDDARIRIRNSVAMKNGQEIQPPNDRLNTPQPIQDFPKTLVELSQNVTAERRVALLTRFGVTEQDARAMGEEAGRLALRVWSGCTTFW